MRTMIRNRKKFYYALYQGDTNLVDDDGFLTGERGATYTEPTPYYKGTISPATGTAQTESFGNLENYDKVIVTGDMDCPITETSILWIDEKDITKPHDYVVRRVAKSIDVISIAVAKVKVSGNAS